MNIDDGRVLAIGGGMLADGEFQFDGAEASQFIRPAEWMIEVRSDPRRLGTQFGLRPNPRRDADGLWSADWPIHSVAFQSPLPPLDQLLDFPSFALSSDGVPSDRVRFDLAGEHTSFAWVIVDYVSGSAKGREMLRGVARLLGIEVVRTAEALEFQIEAPVDDPMRGDEAAAPFTVRVTAKLSFATMALAGSGLWWRGGPDRWALPTPEQTGPLAEVLTLDRAGGAPYFAGALDLGPAQPDFTRGGWVHAYLSDRRLRLRSQTDFSSSRGFVSGSNLGPELVFHNLGTAAWKELLADGDEAVLEQSGAGIGEVQGVTGRDVGETGPHEQPITAVRIRLSRSEEGLRIAFDGQLGKMRQTPRQAPLGPEFHGDFLVPTAFLFARGINLLNQWGERQKRLGKG